MDASVFEAPGIFNVDRIGFNARYHGSRPAIACGECVLEWREFDLRTNRAANGLRAQGIAQGDRIVLLMSNSIEMLVLIWGIAKAGAVVVPVSLSVTAQQRAELIRDCDPKAIFADADIVSEAGEHPGSAMLFALGEAREGWRDAGTILSHGVSTPMHVRRSMADTEIIIYSSGTTGSPKGIELSHQARLIYALGYGPLMHIGPQSVIICATPLYANGAWITMLPAIYWGACTVILPKFTPDEFFRAATRHDGTHAFLVPTQASMLADAATLDTSSSVAMSAVVIGSGRLDAGLRGRVRDALGGAVVMVCYGMTEGFITMATSTDLDDRPGTVGIPIYGEDTRIIDLETGEEAAPGVTGEIVGYGSGLMKGYFRKQEMTRAMVWRDAYGLTYIRTGDVGHVDEDGYLYLSDRIKDMVKSGGLNIYAADLESVFAQHPAVLEAAVVGVPHEKWGETPVLFARLRPGAIVTETALQEWGNARLASFQKVSRVIFRDDFPRGAYDKVLKRTLRAEFA